MSIFRKIPNPKSKIPNPNSLIRQFVNPLIRIFESTNQRIIETWILSFVIGILCILFPATLRAEQGFQPVKISANQMEADRYKRQIIYKGNVKVNQEDMVLSAETLTVKLGDDYRIKEALAQGNVHIVSGNRKVKSEKALFDSQQRRIILLGNPRIYQDGNMVSGEKITLYLGNDRRFFVEGGEKRVVVNLVRVQPSAISSQ